MKCIMDGEFRRDYFHLNFLKEFSDYRRYYSRQNGSFGLVYFYYIAHIPAKSLQVKFQIIKLQIFEYISQIKQMLKLYHSSKPI